MIIKTQDDKNKALNRISLLVLEKPWEIEIKPYKKNRSLKQNRLYFKWMKIIGDELGYESEEVHAIMADKFLTDKFVEYGGKQIKQDKSTSRLNTKEFTDYLQRIDRFVAQQLGIVLPVPDDSYYEIFGIKKSI
jgi:hypothetical protein